MFELTRIYCIRIIIPLLILSVNLDAVEDHVGRATEHTKLAGRQLQDAKVYQVSTTGYNFYYIYRAVATN